MTALSARMTSAAYEELQAWRQQEARVRKEVLALSLELPLLLRRHGLYDTLLFWSNASGDAAQQQRDLARAFRAALCKVVSREQPTDDLSWLRGGSLASYLLYSRLALALADAWVEIAEPVLAPEARAVTGTTREAGHAET